MKKMTNYFFVFLSFIRLIKLLINCYCCYLIEFNVITRYMNLKHEEDFLLVPTPSEASLDPSPSVLQVERGLTCLATVTAPPTHPPTHHLNGDACLLNCWMFLLSRTTAATNMNDVSSRSHAIFTIAFTQVSSLSLQSTNDDLYSASSSEWYFHFSIRSWELHNNNNNNQVKSISVNGWM